MEIIKKYYQVDKKEIAYMKFILEAYEGISILTTIDSNDGIIVLRIAPGCLEEVEIVLNDLRKTISIESINIEEFNKGCRLETE